LPHRLHYTTKAPVNPSDAFSSQTLLARSKRLFRPFPPVPPSLRPSSPVSGNRIVKYDPPFCPPTGYFLARLYSKVPDKQVLLLAARKRKHSLEITFCTQDKPYRLSQLCGVLAMNDLNILYAHAFTRKDGKVIDVFYVEDLIEGIAISDEKVESVRRDLISVLQSREDIQARVEARMLRNGDGCAVHDGSRLSSSVCGMWRQLNTRSMMTDCTRSSKSMTFCALGVKDKTKTAMTVSPNVESVEKVGLPFIEWCVLSREPRPTRRRYGVP
jgi:hypothetical protein